MPSDGGLSRLQGARQKWAPINAKELTIGIPGINQ
jgi:hypothetical protein